MLEVGRTSGGRCTATSRSPLEREDDVGHGPVGQELAFHGARAGGQRDHAPPLECLFEEPRDAAGGQQAGGRGRLGEGNGGDAPPGFFGNQRKFEQAAAAATVVLGDAHAQGPGGDQVGPEVGVVSRGLGGAHPGSDPPPWRRGRRRSAGRTAAPRSMRGSRAPAPPHALPFLDRFRLREYASPLRKVKTALLRSPVCRACQSRVGVPCSPGSIEFDPFSDTFFDDPSATYARLRDEAPVYFNEKYGFYALSRHADVVAAHGDPVRFVSSYGVTLELLLQKQPMNTNMMIVMDPPEHTRMRKLVSQVFSRNAIGSLEPLVAEVIAGYLDALVGRSEFDLVAEFAALFPVEVISTILGVPEGERQQVRLWVDMFLHREEGNPNTTHEGMEATLHMAGYFLDLARAKRRTPDGLLISKLTEAVLARRRWARSSG